MTYIRQALDEIKADLKVLPTLATTRDLEQWRGQWLVVGVGIVALVIAGVVGGLAPSHHYAASGALANPTPIIVQIPASPATPSVKAGR